MQKTVAIMQRELLALFCSPIGFIVVAGFLLVTGITFATSGALGPGKPATLRSVFNWTPIVRRGYRVGVPEPGFYPELVNTDAEAYGGGNVGNAGGLEAEAVPRHGHPCSLSLTLPPLGALILARRTD